MLINHLIMGHGFGINTNILDTNVINLAVVVAIVVSVLGDALRDLLNNRRKTIQANLAAADDKAKAILDRMKLARDQRDQALQKALEIRRQGQAAAKREGRKAADQADAECDRLKQLSADRTRSQQQDASERIARQIVVLSMDDAYGAVEKRLASSRSQIWVNIKKMTYYETIKTYARLLV